MRTQALDSSIRLQETDILVMKYKELDYELSIRELTNDENCMYITLFKELKLRGVRV